MLTHSAHTNITRSAVLADTNQRLARFFDVKISSAGLIDERYEKLWTSISHYSLAGGKRLRPYMTLVAYEAFGGKNIEGMRTIATAQELLHLSMLVHDDIIDRDTLRHGTKNIQGVYIDTYKKLRTDPVEVRHYADSTALLAGDLLLSSAYEMCLESSVPDADKLTAQQYLASAVFSVVGGELLDTDAVLYSDTPTDAKTIALHKTASYSFVTPLVTGASLAHASDADLSTLTDFAEALGIAYQFTDDLLGVFGDEAITGKPTSSDIAEGKQTLLLQEAYRVASPTERATLDELVGKRDLSDNELAAVRTLFITTGAKAKIEDVITSHTNHARQKLHAMKLSPAHGAAFEELIASSTKRTF